MKKVLIPAAILLSMASSPAVAGGEATFRAKCAARGGEVLTTTQVVERGLQSHFREFRAGAKKGLHCYANDRAHVAVLLEKNPGFKAWHDACKAAGKELLTTAEFGKKFPHLAGRIDPAPYHCYRPEKVGATRSLTGR